MKALILAAGYGGRMSPLTNDTHKTLLKINKVTIMDQIISSLFRNGIIDIVVVTGYKANELKDHLLKRHKTINFTFINNERYRETNNIFSLALAFSQIKFDKDLILIESDLIFEDEVLEKAINSKFKNVALVSPYVTGLDGTVVEVQNNKVIGLYPPHLQGDKFDLFDKFKTLNIYKFSKEFCQNEFKKLLVYYAKSIDDNCYYELILGILIYMQKQQIHCEIIDNDKWFEVDDPNDLVGAEFVFNKKERINILEKHFGGYWNHDILDFCFIRNMYFPTKSMMSEMRSNLPFLLENYGSKQTILNLKLSYVLQYDVNRLIVLNGAAQIYPILSKIVGNKNVLIPNPTFGEYERVFTNIEYYNDNVGYNLSEIQGKINNSDFITFVNPNNPTGSIIDTEIILKYIDDYPSKFFIVDESFIEFSDQPSIIESIENKPRNNVLVIRSMSKSYGLPGIRLGFVYSSDINLIKNISEEIPIWNMNSVAEFFMEIILKNKLSLKNSFEQTKLDRDLFIKNLREIKIIDKVYQSNSDFILFKLKDKVEVTNLAQHLIENHSIYIKDISSKFNEISNKFFRISVRLAVENNSLINILKKLN